MTKGRSLSCLSERASYRLVTRPLSALAARPGELMSTSDTHRHAHRHIPTPGLSLTKFAALRCQCSEDGLASNVVPFPCGDAQEHRTALNAPRVSSGRANSRWPIAQILHRDSDSGACTPSTHCGMSMVMNNGGKGAGHPLSATRPSAVRPTTISTLVRIRVELPITSRPLRYPRVPTYKHTNLRRIRSPSGQAGNTPPPRVHRHEWRGSIQATTARTSFLI